MTDWSPRIVTFACNWCAYAGADAAGGLRLEYPAGVKLIRVMCSGRVDPQLILSALRRGADGVLVLGCHPGECHYRSGNLKALKRLSLLKRTLDQLGVDPERVRLDWVAADDGRRFQQVVNEMAQRVAALGRLRLTGAVEGEVA